MRMGKTANFIPSASALGDPGTLDSDAVINLDERHHLTVRARATPPRLTPHQPGPPPEARQIGLFGSGCELGLLR